jgi:hypothetical protein
MAEKDIHDRIVGMGLIPITESPAALETRIVAEQAKWKAVIEKMAVK